MTRRHAFAPVSRAAFMISSSGALTLSGLIAGCRSEIGCRKQAIRTLAGAKTVGMRI
jgi:hypothetical protein